MISLHVPVIWWLFFLLIFVFGLKLPITSCLIPLRPLTLRFMRKKVNIVAYLGIHGYNCFWVLRTRPLSEPSLQSLLHDGNPYVHVPLGKTICVSIILSSNAKTIRLLSYQMNTAKFNILLLPDSASHRGNMTPWQCYVIMSWARTMISRDNILTN